ncbi:MAG: ribosomal L7Ae/L30e/S12e/Gadd45 family protein [Clostridia bacterium]|nr:ribosomal L7Ae/L30e/S12e/Gadd45 family protein [Clostridia bacterium]
MLDKDRLLAGFKQTLKAISDDKAQTIYIANDCDEAMKKQIEDAANEMSCDVVYAESMKELGRMCSISRGASCAVQLK